MRYFVDFYDAFDGWIRRGVEPEQEVCFDNLDEAIQYRDERNSELDIENIRMDEHYGVIDNTTKCEIQCPSGELKMSKKEDTRCFKVDCPMCKTNVDIPIEDFRVISTDQGAGFIQNPKWICERCGSACLVELPEPTGR